jgi:hypothetical protein
MTREDIIRMARKARMPYFYGTWEIANLDGLERFAALVAEHVLRERLAQPENWQYVQKLNAFSYPSYGLMGGDEFVSKDSIKRDIT